MLLNHTCCCLLYLLLPVPPARDIKLENTLLQGVKGLPLPLVKICDFGYSKADFKSAAKSRVSQK